MSKLWSFPCRHVCLSRFSCVWLCETLWTATCHAALSMGFSRQEYWNGLQCTPPRDLPDPGIKPMSLMSPALAGGFFTTTITWEALIWDQISDYIFFITLAYKEKYWGTTKLKLSLRSKILLHNETKWTWPRQLIVNTCLLLLSHFSRVQLCATPQTAAHQNTGVGCHFLLQCMKVKSES